MGFILATTRKDYDGAKTVLTKACGLGTASGCEWLERLPKMKAEDEKPVTDAWAAVVRAGDDLAQRRHMLDFAQKNLSGRRNALASQRLAQHIQALTKESYCPAVRDFLAVSTKTELARRSKDHCENDPPVGDGLSGEMIELKAECRAVFSASCAW